MDLHKIWIEEDQLRIASEHTNEAADSAHHLHVVVERKKCGEFGKTGRMQRTGERIGTLFAWKLKNKMPIKPPI